MASEPYFKDPPRLFQIELWVAGGLTEVSDAARAMARTCGVGIVGPCELPGYLPYLGHTLAIQPFEKGYWPKREGELFLPVSGGLKMVQQEVNRWMSQWRCEHPCVAFMALVRRTDAYTNFDSIVGSFLVNFPNFSGREVEGVGISLGEFAELDLAPREDIGVTWASVSKDAGIGQALLPMLLDPPTLAYLRTLDLQSAFSSPRVDAVGAPAGLRF